MRHATVLIRMAMASTGLCLLLGSAAFTQVEPEGFFPPSEPTIAVTPPLPEPPQQRAAWTAPDTRILAKLVQAADWLFANGLADPRGCEYREIEVLARNVWGSEKTIKTHGWVLPAKEGAAQRFAVAWNGLVYPAMSIGGPANLSADMEKIVAFRKTRDVDSTPIPPPGRSMVSEFGILSHENESRLELALLLRLGEVELAEAYWNAFADKDADRFLEWARVWIWYIYDRAITAHMLGDHGLALAMSQQLADVRPRIEAAAAERGYDKGRAFDGGDRPYLYFLSDYQSPADPVQSLVADSKRRLAAEKSPTLKEVLALPEQTKRVAALVRLLQEVDERQFGQPGGVPLNFSRIVLAFEKEGEAAVDPLITCLESDVRLTRAVEFSRDFGSDRHLIPVFEAAYSALVGVLHTDKFGPSTTHGVGANRAEAAAEVRAYAKRVKGRTLAEQWYDTLSDDDAHPWQWRDATLRIVQPADQAIHGYRMELPSFPAGARPKLHGDELHGKSPSVSALLAKRIPQMTMTKELSSDTLFRAGDAAQMALALVQWEPESARPVLRQLVDRCHELLRIMPEGNSADVVSRSISLLTTKLVELGDPEALREYAQWASRQRPNREIAETLFQPLWKHPDNPAAIAAVRRMFLADDAPWRSLPRIGPGEYGIRLIDESVVASPLVGMSAFRENLLANLADKSRLGVLRVDNGLQTYEWDNRRGGGSSGLSKQADPLVPPPGEERIVRVCDWYAAQLSTLRGAPKFEYYWPNDTRDKAIEAMGNFLRERGDQFRQPAN